MTFMCGNWPVERFVELVDGAERIDIAVAEARSNADSLPYQCRPHRAVSGDSRSQFCAAGVRA